MSEKLIRIYKYALDPTPIQEKKLEECGHTSRFLWNRLVSKQKWAYNEIIRGRRASVENEYYSIFFRKKGGRRKEAIDREAKKLGITDSDEALLAYVKQKVKEDTQIGTNKKTGQKLLKWSARHLSWKYAVEKVNSERHKVFPNWLSLWSGIQVKWITFGDTWDNNNKKTAQNKLGAPRYKKYHRFSAIQKQIHNELELKEYIDLSWCGSECLRMVKVIKHRDLPEGSTVKQIALTRSPRGRWFVCFFLSAKKEVFQKEFPLTEKSIGIDPGFKYPLTTSEGKVIQHGSLFKDKKISKKLKQLNKKLSRQTRLNNLTSLNPNGTFKKNTKIHRTLGMLKTARKIAKIKGNFTAARRDYYHNQSIALLNEADNIFIGHAKMHKLVRGVGASKKAMNSIAYENAISDFKNILQDKANLSVNKKHMGIVNEAYTSCTCSVCGQKTTETKDLDVREWTCVCGARHLRDVNSAILICRKGLLDLAAASQSVGRVKPQKSKNVAAVAHTVSKA